MSTKTIRRWQSQIIPFASSVKTLTLPSSDQLEHMDLIERQALSAKMRSITSELEEFQNILAHHWLDTKS